MPPPRPLEVKGYGITLRPVRLAIDLQLGSTPKERKGECRAEEAGGDASE